MKELYSFLESISNNSDFKAELSKKDAEKAVVAIHDQFDMAHMK